MIKFLGMESVTQDIIHWEDHIDPNVLLSLLPSHLTVLNKINASHSQALSKFITKVSSNHVAINSDILTRIIEHLLIQNTLPISAVSNQRSKEVLEDVLEIGLNQPEYPKLRHWLAILKSLCLWEKPHFSHESMDFILSLTHHFLIQDLSPSSNLQVLSASKARFWKKKHQEANEQPILSVFQFVYEKFKYFHWDVLPNTKRPIDLYELFCLIEDACIEKNMLQMSSDHIEFHRALNASALLFSIIHFFPAAIPDFIALECEELGRHERLCLIQEDDYKHLFEDENYLPLFGTHPHLSDYNHKGMLIALRSLCKHWIHESRQTALFQSDPIHTQIIKLLLEHIHSEEQHMGTLTYLENISKRLNFIFNRLIASGYMMRSPTLRGLGYQPLINIEIPNKFGENLLLFFKKFKALSEEQQTHFLQQILLHLHEENHMVMEAVPTDDPLENPINRL